MISWLEEAVTTSSTVEQAEIRFRAKLARGVLYGEDGDDLLIGSGHDDHMEVDPGRYD